MAYQSPFAKKPATEAPVKIQTTPSGGGYKSPFSTTPKASTDVPTPAPKVKTGKIQPFLGGGEYNIAIGEPNKLIKDERSQEAIPAKSGQERDHIVSVAAGGKSNKENLRYVPNTAETQSGKLEREALADYNAGRISLPQMRLKILTAKQKEEDEARGISTSVTKNLFGGIKRTGENIKQAAKSGLSYLSGEYKKLGQDIASGQGPTATETIKAGAGAFKSAAKTGLEFVRSVPRAVVSAGTQIVGKEEYVPKNKLERTIIGEKPVPSLEKGGKEFLSLVGDEKTIGKVGAMTAGTSLALLDVLFPGGKKKVAEEAISAISKTEKIADIQKNLSKIGIKDEKLAEELIGVSDNKQILEKIAEKSGQKTSAGLVSKKTQVEVAPETVKAEIKTQKYQSPFAEQKIEYPKQPQKAPQTWEELNGQASGEKTPPRTAQGVKQATKPSTSKPKLNSLNPSDSGVYEKYTPHERATAELGDNITTLDKTSGKSPDEMVTVYRGAPKNQKDIVPGDFITTNKQLAKDYAGDGIIIEKKVKMSDILDDKTESLGEEYIYRPKTQAEINHSGATTEQKAIIGGLTPEQKAAYLEHKQATTEARPHFVENFNKISGAKETHLPEMKGDARAIQKASEDYGGEFSHLKDMNRGTFVAHNNKSANEILGKIEKNFKVSRVKNRILNPTTEGYRDMLVNVELPNGTHGEIQIHLPNMKKAKDITHQLYKESRVLDSKARRTASEQAKLEELQAQQKKIYDEAWKKDQAALAQKAQKKESGMWQRVSQGLSHEDQADLLYKGITLKGASKKAVSVVEKDAKRAYRIAKNLEAAPADTTTAAVNIALAEKAKNEGNYALQADLVRSRTIAQVRRGQEIVSEKIMTDNDPQSYIKRLINARLDKIRTATLSKKDLIKEKITGKKTDIMKKEISTERAKVEKFFEKKKFDIKAAQDFINKLACDY